MVVLPRLEQSFIYREQPKRSKLTYIRLERCSCALSPLEDIGESFEGSLSRLADVRMTHWQTLEYFRLASRIVQTIAIEGIIQLKDGVSIHLCDVKRVFYNLT